MFAKIRHVAMYTHNHAVVDNFYQTIFGMRRMTSGTLDETGKQNTGRGHISDGVIGLAILSRYAGMQSGMDHFGFEVSDIKEYVRRMEQHYPKSMIAQGLEYVPFAGLPSYDPAGTQLDIAQAMSPTCVKATTNPAGTSRAGSITSRSAPTTRRKWPSSTKRSSSSKKRKLIATTARSA